MMGATHLVSTKETKRRSASIERIPVEAAPASGVLRSTSAGTLTPLSTAMRFTRVRRFALLPMRLVVARCTLTNWYLGEVLAVGFEKQRSVSYLALINKSILVPNNVCLNPNDLCN